MDLSWQFEQGCTDPYLTQIHSCGLAFFASLYIRPIGAVTSLDVTSELTITVSEAANREHLLISQL